MPFESEAQRKAMYAAAAGNSDIGIPQDVGEKFVKHDSAEDNPTELDIAKSIRDGELTSPQQFANIHLFDVRITGTGTAYRDSLDEYVYRPPEDFLSDDFVERCNGLPLIFEHPETGTLTTDEYRNRSIGVIMLPYIKGDEVWGIAKVFDDDAALLMQNTHTSTSPAVVFRNAGETETVNIDGDVLLIEGKPAYLDHLAICQEGVWDKGGEPSGVALTNGEPEMDEKDTEKMPAWADALLKRMDAMEKASEKEDKEEVKADEAEKEDEPVAVADSAEEADDGDEKAKEAMAKAKEAGEEEKREEDKALEYADSMKKENAELAAKIKAMEARLADINKPVSHADRDLLSRAQARADGVAQMFGEQVPAPLHGETPIEYRKRLADRFKKHSKELSGVRLDSMDEHSFGVIEEKIYADSKAAALAPRPETAGRLIPVVRTDSAGRQITSFHGDIGAWMGAFMGKPLGVRIDKTAGKGV